MQRTDTQAFCVTHLPSVCCSQSRVEEASGRHPGGLEHVEGSSVGKGKSASLSAVGNIRNDELKLLSLGGVLGKKHLAVKTEERQK